jgi:hypothetical protein
MGLVLRTLDALQISLNATTPEIKGPKRPDTIVDIDLIVAAARNHASDNKPHSVRGGFGDGDSHRLQDFRSEFTRS